MRFDRWGHVAPMVDAPPGAPAAGSLREVRRAPPKKSGSIAGHLRQDTEQVRRGTGGRRGSELAADARGAAGATDADAAAVDSSQMRAYVRCDIFGLLDLGKRTEEGDPHPCTRQDDVTPWRRGV